MENLTKSVEMVDNIEMDLKEMGCDGVDLFLRLGIGTDSFSCEHSKKSSVFMEDEEFAA